MGGTTTWQAMRQFALLNPGELFPAACKMANGDVIMVVPRMTAHLAGDGELWKQTGVDNGDGTVSWRGDWTKIYARKGSTWDIRSGLPALVPSGPHAGKVVITVADTNWYAGSISNYTAPYPTTKFQAFCRILLSTDSTCTAFTELATLPPAIPSLVAENCQSNFPEAPVVFLPNGDWMAATWSRETHDYIGWYSSAYYRSTDNGATWTHEGFIDRANTANPVQSTAHMADEPQLLMLRNGEMLCVIRDLAEGRNPNGSNGYTHHLWRCQNPTDRNALVWVDEGPCTVSQAASRPALLQHSNGMVLHGFRVILGGYSAQGAWRVSNDNGHTWNTERNLDTGGITSGNSGTGVYSYGAWVELSDGSLIHVYCQDTGGASYTREARMSVVSDTPAPLTVTANSVWSQSGTVVTATRAPRSTRTTATATVYSAQGGPVQFRGTHASRFEVSLDGTTWASSVTVPAGVTTVYLGVTPQGGDTTLTAQIGIPS